ncbi:MAG: hypothetical protein JWO06_2448 [Bacteroidota bacterium]|nr:hypothetical protein [Bacteroidota bacterium]
MRRLSIILSTVIFLVSCGTKKNTPDSSTQPATPVSSQPLFKIVPASESHIYFSGHSMYPPIGGGGVAIGDINNDGLPDIYFSGDSVNALYLNKGHMVFEDITEKAGVKGFRWSNGVTMADINNDGLLDILVARERDELNTGLGNGFIDSLNVLLYINNGDLTFTEMAKQMGMITKGPLRHGVFLDYNKDNYLDIYFDANYNSKQQSDAIRGLNEKTFKDFHPDFLFQNQGGKHFKNVTLESGVDFKSSRFGFSPYVTDLNQDGWPDLYLNNDFAPPDYLFYNNNGKFKPAGDKTLMQTSFYTMGVDVADINNDGLLDILTLDMRSKRNFRQKSSMWEVPYDWTRLMNEKDGVLQKQQVKNALQLNMGNGTFSQISELAGVDATEWSWSPLIADYDNDGWKDIFITNGNIVDGSFNLDLPYLLDSMRRVMGRTFTEQEYASFIRVQPNNPWFQNFWFKNNGDLSFKNMEQAWGVQYTANSTGAAYADLDNDGDLDLVINNNGGVSFIYENTLNNSGNIQNHFLRIQPVHELHYPIQGTTATIFANGKKQFVELQPAKGVLSNSEYMLHFGTGKTTTVDSLLVKWPDGKVQLIKNVKCDQTLKVFHKDAVTAAAKPAALKTLFAQLKGIGLDYKHEEDNFNDFGVDPLLPQMYSKNGPALAKGDLNGDGLEDIIVGGAVGKPRACFLQNKGGTFTRVSNVITKDIQYEDGGIAIFDMNGDGFNDVYIATGGYEAAEPSERLKHRFYLNDGKGNFIRKDDLIPDIRTSSNTVIAADFDHDGKVDLFIGGRVKVPYPSIPGSYLLKNTGGKLIDVTESNAPALKNVGMVTDAVWTDFNNDKQPDLMLVGEWMPVKFFANNNGRFEDVTAKMNINQKTNGLWNCIVACDVDKDGKTDYLLGNLGLNTRFAASQNAPLELYAGDFDHNGSVDLLSGFYEDGNLYPCKQLRTLAPRINGLSKKYYKTAMFATATLSEIAGYDELQKAAHFTAYETGTCLLKNNGNNSFSLSRLPNEAQFAPVNGIVADDIDKDGIPDLLLVGNFYYAEVERGRYDAFKGLYMKGDGKGNFAAQPILKSGFVVDGDARKIIKVDMAKQTLYIASQNNDNLVTHSITK